MAPLLRTTNEIYYSWNEGLNFRTLTVIDTPIEVENIIIEPSSTSQFFVLYGTKTDPETEETKAIIITLDFQNLHTPQCTGEDRPGEASSDYELWTPFDGRHGDNKCLLGTKQTYVRRKQESQCYNGMEYEKQVFIENCPCTEMDYTCDFMYRRTEGGSCVKMEQQDKPDADDEQDDPDQCNEDGFYYIS